jgi:hypothetical protein
LRLLLAEPLRFTPVEEQGRRGYRFTGVVALDRVIEGAFIEKSAGSSGAPSGLAPLPVVTGRVQTAA